MVALVFVEIMATAFVMNRRDEPDPAATRPSSPGLTEVSEGLDPLDGIPTDGLTGRQRRGKQIYGQGTAASGEPVTAILGESRDAVPASLVSCANCHGRDGRGRAEGGIDPPDLSWAILTRPRAADARRARPAYTPELIARVVTMGLDSAGMPIGVGMPRYQLSTRDLADLLEYLRILGTETDPGITDRSIRLGTLLPPKTRAPELRKTLLRTLEACIEDLNRRGGVYQRSIVLESRDLPDDPEMVVSAVTEHRKSREVFALIAPYLNGTGGEAATSNAAKGIPVVGPFTSDTPFADPTDRSTFYIHPGLNLQARALSVIAARQGPLASPAVLQGEAPILSRAGDEAAAALERLCGVTPGRFTLSENMTRQELARFVESLRERRTDAIVFLGPEPMIRPLIEEAERASWHPRIYLPSALWAGRWEGLPPGFDGRIAVSLPYMSGDVSRSGRSELERLRAEHGLPRQHDATQIAVLAAFRVLEEGIRRCGRAISRARLVDELSRLSEYETGYSRPVTFGPSRRVGSAGAYILTLGTSGRRFSLIGWTGLGENP
jgi:ABC-type branched-subunit amino acid transport system substrate-binding protein